jgi:hypothetical protein
MKNGGDKDFLHRQLIKLGDMMGDGLHHEPDGRWIPKEYKKILRALGIGPKRKNFTKSNNEAMEKRLKNFKCPSCLGELKQTRPGSLRAKCLNCGNKYQVLKRA